jgi:hypothetical protein
MSHTLGAVRGASIPTASLSELGELRREAGISVVVAGERTWVRWADDNSSALRRIMAVRGAELHDWRDGRWFRHGDRLPAFHVPFDHAEAMPIYRAIYPLPVQAVPALGHAIIPATFRLVSDDRVRPSSALRCGLHDFGAWSEMATSAQLSALRGVVNDSEILVVGAKLPPIASAQRYWGRCVLVPLGQRPDPDLPEAALRRVLGAGENEYVLLGPDGLERITREMFGTITRGAVRVARGEVVP